MSRSFAGLSKHGLDRVLAHGLTGRAFASLQGGNFGHGFFSASVSKYVDIKLDINGASLPTRAVADIITGGTVSQLTGGKFANGAVTSAFQFAFNALLSGKDLAAKYCDYERLDSTLTSPSADKVIDKFSDKLAENKGEYRLGKQELLEVVDAYYANMMIHSKELGGYKNLSLIDQLCVSFGAADTVFFLHSSRQFRIGENSNPGGSINYFLFGMIKSEMNYSLGQTFKSGMAFNAAQGARRGGNLWNEFRQLNDGAAYYLEQGWRYHQMRQK